MNHQWRRVRTRLAAHKVCHHFRAWSPRPVRWVDSPKSHLVEFRVDEEEAVVRHLLSHPNYYFLVWSLEDFDQEVVSRLVRSRSRL